MCISGYVYMRIGITLNPVVCIGCLEVKRMGRIQVVLDDKTEERLRDTIYKTKGMKKGNISDAIEEAIELWIQEQLKVLPEQKVKSR